LKTACTYFCIGYIEGELLEPGVLEDLEGQDYGMAAGLGILACLPGRLLFLLPQHHWLA
jgi:hypothetical protein